MSFLSQVSFTAQLNSSVAANSCETKTQVIRLSDRDLESSLKDLVRQERTLLHEILLHIREVDRRKLFLDRARSSLFDYLVTELGYSSSAAMRRIEASRLLIQVPELAVSIQEGKINLTQVGELSRALKEKERETGKKIDTNVTKSLLVKMEHKSSRETQQIVAEELDLQLRPVEEKRVQKENSVSIQMTLTAGQYEKLMQVQQGKGFSFNQIIESLCDRLLEANAKNKKAVKSCDDVSASKKNTTKVISDMPILASPKATASTATKKATEADLEIGKPTSTRGPRDSKIQTCCQYRDSLTGNECKSTFALEQDHIHPLWAGGADVAENIQILCAAHNKHRYARQAGIRVVPCFSSSSVVKQ